MKVYEPINPSPARKKRKNRKDASAGVFVFIHSFFRSVASWSPFSPFTDPAYRTSPAGVVVVDLPLHCRMHRETRTAGGVRGAS